MISNKEAIEAIKSNYPDSRYSILREALDMAIEALEKSDKYKWHDIRKDKNDLPTEDGWYDCWIRVIDKDGEIYINYGMDLYYYTRSKKFMDNRRRNVFEIYDVMAFDPDTRVPFDKKKIYSDSCCDRTAEVIAWKEMEVFNG